MTTADGRSFIARFAPYRSAEDKIEGVVLSFIDITHRKETEDALKKANVHLQKHNDELEDNKKK